MNDKAPVLLHNGKKNRGTSNYFRGCGIAQRSHELEDKLMQGLGDKDMAALKVMLFLTGNAGDGKFRISEKIICECCNLSPKGYKAARKKLCDMGWISFYPKYQIIVNFDNIYKQTTADNVFVGKTFSEIRPKFFDSMKPEEKKELWDRWCKQNNINEPMPNF